MILSTEFDYLKNPLTPYEIQYNLIRKLCHFKHEISDNKVEYPISKSQGTCFNDFFVAKILQEVNATLDIDFQGLSTPFLNLTSDVRDSFEKTKLILFFEEEIIFAQKINPVNYTALKIHYQEFASRLFKATL